MRLTWDRLAKEALADFDPSASVKVLVEHELEQERDVVLEDPELGLEERAAAKNLGHALLVLGVDGVNLEVRAVPDRVAVEWDALARHDERDKLGRTAIARRLVALLWPRRERELDGAVESSSEAQDVRVHCIFELEG